MTTRSALPTDVPAILVTLYTRVSPSKPHGTMYTIVSSSPSTLAADTSVWQDMMSDLTVTHDSPTLGGRADAVSSAVTTNTELLVHSPL